MPSSKTERYLGVDVGGTKILTGVFDGDFQCIGRAKVSTKPERGPKEVIERIARCIREAVDECDLKLGDISAVGVGAPGPIDRENGRVIVAPNLGWRDIALRKELEREVKLPVFIDNDCHVCMLGVYELEFKAKPRSMVGIFLGTGIGGGLVLDGNIIAGANNTAGELGHMIVMAGGPKCPCGNRGCFEALASRTALYRRLHSAIEDGEKTVLTEWLGNDLANLRSGDLRKAFKAGDKLVQKIVKEASEYIGIGVASIANIFDPERIVLGGGVISALQEHMMPTIEQVAGQMMINKQTTRAEISTSKLEDDAGISGAAVLAKRSLAAC